MYLFILRSNLTIIYLDNIYDNMILYIMTLLTQDITIITKSISNNLIHHYVNIELKEISSHLCTIKSNNNQVIQIKY